MKIDLHVHTRERSACASASEDQQVKAAIAAGLDAIVITDHARLIPTKRVRALNQRYAPFQVFGGIEIATQGEHILVIGIQDPVLERQDWSYAELHAFVRSRQGFMALAHPYRYQPRINLALDQLLPDAVEVYSNNTPPAAEQDIRRLSTQLRITLVSNSDAHTTAMLGKHYNILPQAAENESALVSLLKAGPFPLEPDRLIKT